MRAASTAPRAETCNCYRTAALVHRRITARRACPCRRRLSCLRTSRRPGGRVRRCDNYCSSCSLHGQCSLDALVKYLANAIQCLVNGVYWPAQCVCCPLERYARIAIAMPHELPIGVREFFETGAKRVAARFQQACPLDGVLRQHVDG